jgi:hypothetical protein
MGTDLNKLLDCPLCISLLSKPINLPCLHTFCDSCIKSYIRTKVGSGTVQCPVCRSPFDSQTSLSHDFFKQSLVDISLKSKPCPRHGSETIIRFCRSCTRSLCADCLVHENHGGHDVVKPDIAEKQTADVLAKYQDQVAEHTSAVEKSWNYFSQHINDTVASEARNEVNRQADKICDIVKKKASALVKMIDDEQQQWKANIVQHHATTMATLGKLDDSLKISMTLSLEDKVKFNQEINKQVTETTSSKPDWAVLARTLKITFTPIDQSQIDLGTLVMETVDVKKVIYSI